DQGQRQARRADPRCSLVGRDRDQGHRQPVPPVADPGSTATPTLLLAALQVTAPAAAGSRATRTSTAEALAAAGGALIPSTTAFEASRLPGVPGHDCEASLTW